MSEQELGKVVPEKANTDQSGRITGEEAPAGTQIPPPILKIGAAVFGLLAIVSLVLGILCITDSTFMRVLDLYTPKAGD